MITSLKSPHIFTTAMISYLFRLVNFLEVIILTNIYLINLARVNMRLDIFHALNRIARVLKKSHGAFCTFMAKLRDAFFLVCLEDMELVEEVLKNIGFSDLEIKDKKDQDWVFFLHYCRRAVPPKEILLKRFDKVCQMFRNLRDAKSGDVFFSVEAKWEIENLRAHIKNNCLSDVTDIPLYFETSQSANGLPCRRCCRGTNSNEGYHSHMRKILQKDTASPQLAHLALMEFNFRWNVSMAIKHGGLPEDCGGFYDLADVEVLNLLSNGIYAQTPFQNWKGVLEFEDTMERSCLRSSFSNAKESDKNIPKTRVLSTNLSGNGSNEDHNEE